MIPRTRAPKKEIVGWAMFDFANQSYTLLIITVVFGDLFTRVIVGDAPDYRLGNLLWSISVASSYLLVVLTAPVVGAVVDHNGQRKQALFLTYALTIVTTAALWFVAPGMIALGMALVIVSNFAYALGEVLLASFLPSLGPPEDLGRISGFGWSLGYLGGMVSALFVLFVLGDVTAENFDRIRWVGPWAAVFFLVAALPTFIFVREPPVAELPPAPSYLRAGVERVRGTLKHLESYRDLAVLLASIFFAMSGIAIIVTFAFIYGAQVIQWDERVRTFMFVVVQVMAAAGAFGFGQLQDRIGGVRTYRLTLLVWIVAILLIWSTPMLVDLLARAGIFWEAQYVFLVAGSVAGICLGGCQSAARAMVGVLSPLVQTAEMFGFWGLAVRAAGVFGVLAIGLLQVLVGLQTAVLFCVLLFAIAWVIAATVDEGRGREAAANADRRAGHG